MEQFGWGSAVVVLAAVVAVLATWRAELGRPELHEAEHRLAGLSTLD